MQRIVRISTAAVFLALITCGGLDTFSISESSTAVIQGSPLPDPLGLFAFTGFSDMRLTDNAELENQGVEKHQIDSVHITRIALRITQPSGQDFGFIDTLAFYVEAPGEARQRVASGGPFPAGASSVELTVDDVELAPYAAAEAMSLTTEVDGRAPAEDVTIEAVIDLDVDVNVSGALCGE